MAQSKVIWIYTTFPSASIAKKTCNKLLNEKLIACAVLQKNVESLYLWKNRIQIDTESVVFLKTHKKLLKKLEKRYLELHPYDTPCFLALPIVRANAAYEKWLTSALSLNF